MLFIDYNYQVQEFMEQRFFYFNDLNSQQSIYEMFQIFEAGVYENGQFNKQFAQKFISQLYFYLQNPSSSGKTKFNAMKVLRQIILKKDSKMIGAILSSTQFLDFLQKNIQNTDPKKPIHEKGRNLFQDDREGYGNKYITLIIDTMQFLSKKFPTNRKNESTRFKKIQMSLQSQNINLPQQNTYYKQLKKHNQQQKPRQQKSKYRQQQQYQKQNKNKPNFQVLIKFVKCKIDQYLASLQDTQQMENMQQIILKTHQILRGEISKFNQIQQSIYQTNDQLAISKYIKIRGFLQQQGQAYHRNISNNKFTQYHQQLKKIYQQIFPQQNQTDQHMQKQLSNQKNRTNGSDLQHNKNTDESKKLQNITQEKINAQVLITGIFTKIQNKDKSPYKGFKELKQSLQKQKKNTHLSPFRSNVTGKMVSSNVSKSKLPTNSIFQNVPNSTPPFKKYQGQLLLPCKQIQNILYDIKKEQSYRRFKISNFKNKNPLFQNQTLQIGFKSQHIFQQFDGFDTFLSVQLYFGNKSDNQIRDLSITFQSDENSLIYSNPMQINPYIDAQMQMKHGLMIIPIQVPFCFINMKLRYQCGSNTIRTTVALPNSILQLSTLVQTDPSSFYNYWNNATTIIKTQQFKLSQHFPPNSIRKYMTNLSQLSSYSQFSLPQSTTDYEVCCLVDVKNDYEGALKINFRPNLNVVIQMGMISPSFDGQKYIKFYVQTLQFLLQQSNE